MTSSLASGLASLRAAMRTAAALEAAPQPAYGAVGPAVTYQPRKPPIGPQRRAAGLLWRADTGAALAPMAGGDPDHGPRPDGSSGGWGGTAAPHAAEPGDAEHSPEAQRTIALVKLAQSGDAEAFGQLYDAYADTVYRYVYYRVSARMLAEDLTQETFLRALRRITTFTWQGRDFGAWLVTIARNLVADHFKSSRHRLEVTTGEMLDSDESVPSPEDKVVGVLSDQELLAAVRQLNPQQQECVVLRFLQGHSVAETARIMGKNEGAVKTLQYRAVRTLARLLPEEFR
jgi:RNA polymerase sigma-70 factor (ECF subfamily)